MDEDGSRVWQEQEGIRRKVLAAFQGHDIDLFLFGSRAAGESRANSDYDIGYYSDNPIAPNLIVTLKEELEELPIPAKVELVDFQKVTQKFIEIAIHKNKVIVWKQKEKNSLFT
ncbi:nucleotidyltransferase domain-containing protein [Heliorestis convoluta]|nr:nucleotidyltransferase domain-containing protein [Heliorestis convoluta]